MKQFASATMLAACFLTIAPVVRAQDCSGWNNSHLRGTWTMTGSGYIDLSKLVPGNPAGLPSGMIPMTWVGAHTYDGAGGGSGWVIMNAGGAQINAQLNPITYAVNADCSVNITFSMKAKELPGVTIGPVSRVLAISGKMGALELHGILVGGGPGTWLDLMTSRRISMQ